MKSALPECWSIRFVALVEPRVHVIDMSGLSMGALGISGFVSRDAATAWAARYMVARIVDTAVELSTSEPTCFIEQGDILGFDVVEFSAGEIA